MKDQRFEESNQRKIILVVDLTDTGKSSFINFMTDKNLCKVSDEGTSCTKDFEMVELYYDNKMYYFVDTPGLDVANGHKKNIEVIKKFKNIVPRINTIIYCQNLTVPRFDNSTKTLFELIKELYHDFSHLIIVRNHSDRSSDQFKENKNKSNNKIYDKLKEYSMIGDDQKEIPNTILIQLEKMMNL